ncbi:hypothetical protein E4U31_001230 [Claviceps sp. LM219 group G6]|nr:hypothetical protein E4U31_001230 [Claviceps sp. LM219 group G6]
MKVPESPTGDETVVTPVDAAHSRQPRWVGIPMPIKPVPLVELPEGVVIITDCSAAPVSTAKREQDWPKVFDDKPIPFPEGETPEHIGLVRQGDIEKDAPFVKGPEQSGRPIQLATDDMPSAPHPDDERKPGPQEAQITSQMRGHLFRFKKKANS